MVYDVGLCRRMLFIAVKDSCISLLKCIQQQRVIINVERLLQWWHQHCSLSFRVVQIYRILEGAQMKIVIFRRCCRWAGKVTFYSQKNRCSTFKHITLFSALTTDTPLSMSSALGSLFPQFDLGSKVCCHSGGNANKRRYWKSRGLMFLSSFYVAFYTSTHPPHSKLGPELPYFLLLVRIPIPFYLSRCWQGNKNHSIVVV